MWYPIVEDGNVCRKVCFSNRWNDCKTSTDTFVKNCGSYFIYKLHRPPSCNSRFCGTKWTWSKVQYTLWSKRIHKSLRRYMCIRFLTYDVVNYLFLSLIMSAGTDWIWSKFNLRNDRMYKSIRKYIHIRDSTRNVLHFYHDHWHCCQVFTLSTKCSIMQIKGF